MPLPLAMGGLTQMIVFLAMSGALFLSGMQAQGKTYTIIMRWKLTFYFFNNNEVNYEWKYIKFTIIMHYSLHS